MIFIGIGSNLPSETFGAPREVCEAALERLAAGEVSIVKRSPWYESAPVPMSDQPWFVNGVVSVATALRPHALLERLHEIEVAFGRVRRVRNEARILDLDLLAYGELIIGGVPEVPHPRLHERAFVLLPLRDIASDWLHPVSAKPIEELIAELPEGRIIRQLA